MIKLNLYLPAFFSNPDKWSSKHEIFLLNRSYLFTTTLHLYRSNPRTVNYRLCILYHLSILGALTMTIQLPVLLSPEGKALIDSIDTTPYRYIHYFKSKSECYVILSKTVRPVGARLECSGKVEARRQARHHNCSPWNF